MGGWRNWLFLDERAEEVRLRVTHWEHRETKPQPAFAGGEWQFAELRAMIDELHETEEELRYAVR